DMDPSVAGETLRFGETGGFDCNDEFSVVFVESCREQFHSFLNSDNETVLENYRNRYQKLISYVSAHEIGHHPGTQHVDTDHEEGDLMSEGLHDVNFTTFDNAKFSPKTIIRFRKCNRWAE
ncbi:MAG TPA: hypothetical protein VLO11_03080, partial [Luteolibacter sp.]|nr:hypothetical protein [Luteolibacter sp.]